MSANKTNTSAVSLFAILSKKFGAFLTSDDCSLLASDYYARQSDESQPRQSVREFLVEIGECLADGINPADIIRLDMMGDDDAMMIDGGDEGDTDNVETDADTFDAQADDIDATERMETRELQSIADAIAERSAFPPIKPVEVPQTSAGAKQTPYVRQYPHTVLELCRESVLTRDNVPCTHRLTDTVIVGSDESRADMVIGSRRTMARAHAKLFRQGDCWVVEPLQDLSPTYLKRRVLPMGTRAHIRHGDYLVMGDEHYYARLVSSPYTESGRKCDHPTLAEMGANSSPKTNGNGKANQAEPGAPTIVVCPATTIPVLQTTIRREIVSDKSVIYGACADIVSTALGMLRRCEHVPEENSEFGNVMRSLGSVRETLTARSKIAPTPVPVAVPVPVVASEPTVPTKASAPVVKQEPKQDAPKAPTAPAAPITSPVTPKQEPKQGESVRVNGFTISAVIPSDAKLRACGVPILAAYARHNGIDTYKDKEDIIRQLQAKRDSKTERVPVVLDKPTPSVPSAPVKASNPPAPVVASTVVLVPTVATSAPTVPVASGVIDLGQGRTIRQGRDGWIGAKDGKVIGCFRTREGAEKALGIESAQSAPAAPTVPVSVAPKAVAKIEKAIAPVALDIPNEYKPFVKWLSDNAEAREILIDRYGIRAEFEAIQGKGAHIKRAGLLWSAYQASNGATSAPKAPKQETKTSANPSVAKATEASKASKIEGKDSATRLGLTTGAYRVLEVLARHEGMSLTYARIVMKCEKVTMGNMSAIRSELESKGWVNADTDAIDGREKIVLDITEEGIEALASVIEG